MTRRLPVLLLLATASLLLSMPAIAQTAFSYQGRLVEQGAPADGDFDFEFDLYTDVSSGILIASGATADDVAVRDGYFVAQIDFGGVFDGTAAWLEVKVRPGDSTGAYTTLTPRQAITLAPLALVSEQALSADQALVAQQVDWSDITNVPADIADGDNDTDTDTDTLAALACADDQIAQRVSGSWQCVDNSDAALLTRIQGVDGSGSGIDADTVDGAHASSFASSGDIASLNAQISALQTQINNLQTPYILGRSAQTSNGRFSFGGQNGIRAANAMCVSSFPSTPSAHLCTLSELQRAIAANSYDSGNAATFDNLNTWSANTIEASNTRTSGLTNTCQGLMYNSADNASGTRVSVDLGYTSTGNGGGVTGDVVKVDINIGCGSNMPVLCCR